MTGKLPPMTDVDDPERVAGQLCEAFRKLHGVTILEAATAMRAGLISKDQFGEAFDGARLMIETGGRA